MSRIGVLMAGVLCLACAPGGAADLEALNVTEAPYGAPADGKTDATDAFQRALHDAGARPGGGTVYVPRGVYLLEGVLRFPPNVTLEGVAALPLNTYKFWNMAERGDEQIPGSVLMTTHGEGDENAAPFISLHTNCALKGITIYHPNQVKENPPRAYPWTVAVTEGGADHCTLIDVVMVNPYKAVDFGSHGSGRHFIQNLYAYPLYRGLFIDNCYDIGRVTNVHFWPFWGYTGDEDALGRWVSENAEAFIIGRTDWEYFTNCFCIFYKVGFHFIKTDAGSPNVMLTQSGSDLGPYAVLVDDCQSHAGISFSNAQLFGRVKISDTNTGPVRFSGCGFFGATREEPFRDPVHLEVAGSGHVSLDNCHLITLDPRNTGKVSVTASGGGLTVMNCVFLDAGRTQFQLEEGLRTAIITGNTFHGPERIVDQSSAKTAIGMNVDALPPAEEGALIIDNADTTGFATEGEWYIGKGGGDYAGAVAWTEEGDGSRKAFWRPDLPEAGNYAVSVWYCADPYNSHAGNAPFTVHHASGEETIRVDLKKNTAQWVELGVFPFAAGTTGYVSLSNDADDDVIADAVKFVAKD